MALAFGEPLLIRGGAPPSLSPGYVRLTTIGGSTRATLDLLMTGEAVDQGGDAWTRQTRPQNVPVTAWPGGILLEYDVPVLLDGHAAGRPIQTEWDALTRLWRPAGGVKPPQLKIDGPLPHSGGTWVVANVTPTVDETIGLPKRDRQG